jgi:CheY-like chemotaxis protein
MISALMVSRDKKFFAGIENVLAENNIKTDWIGTGGEALSIISKNTMLSKNLIELLIIDEALPDMTGRQFIGQVVEKKNPMINCVISSPLIKKKFHQAYEGFGILMQFPVMPGRKEVQKLLKHINHIFTLQAKQ